MRWIFVLFITLLAFFGQAQDESVRAAGDNPNRETIAVLVQLTNNRLQSTSLERSALDGTAAERIIIEPVGKVPKEFILESFLPVKDYPKEITDVIPGIKPGQLIIPLGPSVDKSSACSDLGLGQVSFDGEITAETLQELREALAAKGLTVLGVDGNNAHGTDMARPSKPGGEKQFFDSANVSAAQSLVSSSNTLIAILDTGISTTALTVNPFKADYIEFDNDPQDMYEDYMNGSVINKGHGTPIAHLAHLVSPNADILPIRVCDYEGQCETTRVILGICHALNVAADAGKQLILNLSFSGVFPAGADPMKSALYQVLKKATDLDSGALVATEVGNRGLDPNPRYPAAFTNSGLSGLVSVSGLQAYGSSFAPAYYSTRGNYIDVAALGSDVYVGQPMLDGNTYSGGYSGSSFATPWVAGALSLMADFNSQRLQPPLTSWEIKYCLTVTTQPPMPPVVAPQELGAGMIDMNKAMKCVYDYPNYP